MLAFVFQEERVLEDAGCKPGRVVHTGLLPISWRPPVTLLQLTRDLGKMQAWLSESELGSERWGEAELSHHSYQTGSFLIEPETL